MFAKSRFSEGSTAHSTAALKGLEGAEHLTVRHSSQPQKDRPQRPVSQRELSQMMNAETLKFLNKHFPRYYEQNPTLNSFVCAILRDYEGLWTPEQAAQVETHFVKKLSEMLEAGSHVDIIRLTTATRDNGIIGLILAVFRQLKDEEESTHPQSALANNLASCKNILQEFMESMYVTIENELYGKFNIEMRRMLLKHKEADRMIKKLNELLNEHSDVVDFGRKLASTKRQYEEQHQESLRELNKLQLAFEREQLENESLQKEIAKLQAENERLSLRLERLQDSMIGAYRPHDQNPGSQPSRPHQFDGAEEFPARHTTASRNRGLSFFVGEDKSICLGAKGQAASRTRLSHPNKENIMDAANRPIGRMLL